MGGGAAFSSSGLNVGGDVLVLSPLAIHCTACNKVTEIFDSDLHGYDPEVSGDSATMRGTTSTSIGSKPMVRSASISSRIFIEPTSAVIALPERPAIMIEVSSTPISRNCRMPTRSTPWRS